MRGYCFDCFSANCIDANMPKLLISAENSYYTKFKVYPSKALYKDFYDWGSRLNNKVTGMKEHEDYEIVYNVKSKSKSKNNR